jgi:hypothetical protein
MCLKICEIPICPIFPYSPIPSEGELEDSQPRPKSTVLTALKSGNFRRFIKKYEINVLKYEEIITNP